MLTSMAAISAGAVPRAGRLGRTAALAGLLACLTACMPLLSENPAGDAPHPLDATWEGTWVPQNTGDGPAYPLSLRVRDAAKGELEVAWLEQDGSQFAVRRETMSMRRAGPLLLANLPYAALFKRGSADGRPPLYMWARIERSGSDHVSVSAPILDGFRPYLGPDLHFAGKKESDYKDAAVVKHVSGDLLRRLQAGDQVWATPVIYRKLPAPDTYPLLGP